MIRAIAPTLVTLVVLAAPLAAQQPGGPPPAARPPENLQVLPKDLARDSVTAIMRTMSNSLGVRCTYCHVQAPGGQGPPRFAADGKREKEVARFMMRMTDSLNRVVLASIPVRHDPPVAVTCVTCHRGSPLPQTIDAILVETIDRVGVDSAVARYRRLRGEMAAGRYDFGELPVNDLARRLTDAGKTTEALALLRMNQEHHPGSAEIDVLLGEAHLKRGDRGQALVHYRAALVKRPDDARLRQRVQELGGDPVRK